MTPENLHDFFLTSGGVAGALIGLLFVVISVFPGAVGRAGRYPDPPGTGSGRARGLHRRPGGVAVRRLRWHDLLDVAFLAALFVTFVIQLIAGAQVIADPADASAVQLISILIVVCFLVGVGCAWELIGGPSVGLRHEISALAHHDHKRGAVTGEPSSSPPS